jgi:hypothetical protein
MRKPRRVCIFCGGGRSAEHFWPQWMHPYLAKPDFKHKHEWAQRARMLSSGIIAVKNTKNYKRQGNIETKTVRVVCQYCNNTWMSQIEERAKDSFISIFQDNAESLRNANLSAIREWAALKIFVADHASAEDSVIPIEDCIKFRIDRLIPPYLKIYLGLSVQDELSPSMMRYATTLGASPNPPSAPGKNIQTTAFWVQRAFFYATACRAADINPKIKAPFEDFLFRLHPLEEVGRWPLIKRMSSAIALGVATSLRRRLDDPRTRWVP